MKEELKKKNILVLCGGWSDEREISLISGKAVYDSLLSDGYRVRIMDFHSQDKALLTSYIRSNQIDLVFNLMHGVGGEDGLVQSYLDDIDVKYVGSNSKSSERSFNKIATKDKWLSHNIPTPKYSALSNIDNNFLKLIQKSKKIIVKPISSGSSVGINIFKINDLDVTSVKKLIESINKHYDNFIIDEYFIEEHVSGEEYTAPIVDDKVLPIVKIDTMREFYNYQAKYEDDDTKFSFPSFDLEFENKIKTICLNAFNVLESSGWGRIDFFLDKAQNIKLIELNSIPGMTSHSLVPMSAKKNGWTYLNLIETILLTTND